MTHKQRIEVLDNILNFANEVQDFRIQEHVNALKSRLEEYRARDESNAEKSNYTSHSDACILDEGPKCRSCQIDWDMKQQNDRNKETVLNLVRDAHGGFIGYKE